MQLKCSGYHGETAITWCRRVTNGANPSKRLYKSPVRAHAGRGSDQAGVELFCKQAHSKGHEDSKHLHQNV